MIKIPGFQDFEKLYESLGTLVYRAVRQTNKQPVVIKVINSKQPSIEAIARLKHEAKILEQLKGEGLPQFLELIQTHNTFVLVLEDFNGTSLLQLLQSAYFDLKPFLDIAIQIAEILGRIHQNQVIHKDINPSNLIFNPESKRIQIIDFGISSRLSREIMEYCSPEQIEGTLAYISPEQTGRMNQDIDYRTDFYSTGATFYELLTGRTPFNSSDPMELVHSQIAKKTIAPRQLVPDIPETVEAIIMKLLSKNKEDRYQSAYGLKKDLEQCLENLEGRGVSESFQLGKRDISQQLHVPEKLYGRGDDIAQLQRTFTQVTAGKTSMLLVAGYAGIGKTSFVNEIQKSTVQSHGYFISGKFDQFMKEFPFFALIRAFKDLIQQLLTQTKIRLNQWESKIQEGLKPNAQLIIEVIPELELIIGKQAAVADLAPAEALNRFNIWFRKFVGIFATKEHPLVIFLDDLQWADNASLDLIKSLITDHASQYLLFIGAYRNNEVNSADPLMLLIDNCLKQNIDIKIMALEGLSLNNVNELIADTLHCEPSRSKELATLVFEKTDGNPYFAREFLMNLYRKKLLWFEVRHGLWEWNLGQIRQIDLTANVVELLSGKISQLPEQAQEVLKLASCIGSQFDLKTLSLTYGKSLVETAEDLWEALTEGFILPLGENYRLVINLDLQEQQEIPKIIYKFQHDRVQQAVGELFSGVETEKIHLRIGRLLLLEIAEDKENLIKVVNHINMGRSLIRNPVEKRELAHLNFEVGAKIKRSTAYRAAFEHFKIGIELLSPVLWGEDYDLAYDLWKEQIECEYLIGLFDEAEKHLEMLFPHCRSKIQEGELYLLRITYNTGVGRFQEAIQAGISGLSLFDIEVPSIPESKQLQEVTQEVQHNLEGKQFADLIDLPPLAELEQLLCMKVLSLIFAPAYVTGQIALVGMITLKMTNIAIQYGDFEGRAFSLFGMHLMGLENLKDGYELVHVATKKSPDAVLPAFLMGAYVGPWRIPLSQCTSYLEQAYKNALAAGDLTYARYAASFYFGYTYFLGESLEKSRELYDRYSVFIEESGDPMVIGAINVVLIAISALVSGEREFNDELLGEKVSLEKTNPLVHTQYCASKAQVAFIFGDYKGAFEAASEAEKTKLATIGHFTQAQRIFYLGLSTAALYSEWSEKEKKNGKEILEMTLRQLEIWAESTPGNAHHKFLLLSAEVNRIFGKFQEAIQLYEEAIEKAKENGFLHDVALANELAGNFYFSSGTARIAKEFMKEARYWYHRWGAHRKIKQLDERYPFLLEHSERAQGSVYQNTVTVGTSTGSLNLDLNSVMKSSQAISGEIVLDQLLKKMMKILIENAGAEKGYLILKKGEALVIEAEGRVDQENVLTLQAVPIDLTVEREESPLPVALLSYVLRTKKEVVLKNAKTSEQFAMTPYMVSRKPKSVLCVPLLQQGQLIGLIYMENNLTTGAFSSKRLEMIRLLAGQAAISLENALLYDNLEEKVEQRTHELREVNSELQESYRQITDSVNYASRIQEAALPALDAMDKFLDDYFILNKPRSVVSGDFYWAKKIGDKIYVAAADCTGHGVPGALVSMLGMAFLNEVVIHLSNQSTISPGNILNELRTKIKAALQQKKGMQSNREGMDISLCILDLKAEQLQFAGAYNPLFLLRNDHLIEIKGDRMPVSQHINEQPFTSHEIPVQKGDMIYLFSDGYVDQFGGESKKKFMKRNFKKLLIEIHKEPAVKQREILLERFNRWKGEHAQIDDVLIFGIRL